MKKILGVTAAALGGTVAGAIAGAIATDKFISEEANKVQEMSDKHFALYLMMNQWVRIKQDGKHLSSYFEEQGYKNIAIYGMNYVGETLLRELENTSIEVKYAVDKKGDYICAEIEVWQPEDDLEPVDAVVVTAISFMDEIKELLSKKVSCPILSLKDILDEM